MDQNTSCTAFRPPSRLAIIQWVCLAFCLTAAGCARLDSKQMRGSTPLARTRYVASFTASRLKDHSGLVSVVLPLALGQKTTLRTAGTAPTEDTPVLPRFSATLKQTRTPGVFQLVTMISIREAQRTKKGKLKTSERNQGALLPILLGEAQIVSTTGDPVQIEVRVERR